MHAECNFTNARNGPRMFCCEFSEVFRSSVFFRTFLGGYFWMLFLFSGNVPFLYPLKISENLCYPMFSYTCYLIFAFTCLAFAVQDNSTLYGKLLQLIKVIWRIFFKTSKKVTSDEVFLSKVDARSATLINKEIYEVFCNCFLQSNSEQLFQKKKALSKFQKNSK